MLFRVRCRPHSEGCGVSHVILFGNWERNSLHFLKFELAMGVYVTDKASMSILVASRFACFDLRKGQAHQIYQRNPYTYPFDGILQI